MYYIDLSLDNFNILDMADDEKVINLIVIDSSLKYNLMVANFADLYSHVIVNSSYSRYSFVDRLIFIIYKKIYSRPIRGIKGSQI